MGVGVKFFSRLLINYVQRPRTRPQATSFQSHYLYKFGQALFKLGEINEDEDSVAAYDSLRARNRSGSPAKSIGDKYHGLSYWQFFRRFS